MSLCETYRLMLIIELNLILVVVIISAIFVKASIIKEKNRRKEAIDELVKKLKTVKEVCAELYEED